MTYEINFVPARGRGHMVSYRVTAPSRTDAVRTARQWVDVEAPGYKLHSSQEIAA